MTRDHISWRCAINRKELQETCKAKAFTLKSQPEKVKFVIAHNHEAPSPKNGIVDEMKELNMDDESDKAKMLQFTKSTSHRSRRPKIKI